MLHAITKFHWGCHSSTWITSWDLSLLAQSGPDPITGSEPADLAEESTAKAPHLVLVHTHTTYFTCLIWML